MQLDGALADLLALVHTHGTVHPDIAKRVTVSPAATLPEYESTWPFKLSDLVDPRQAAVLLLFGALDDRPATFQRTIVPQELDVLLTQRSMALRNHPGQVSFPGGGVEPQDDDEVDCAIRETYEETGVDPTGIIPLGKLPELPLPVSNFRVTPVVGWWQHPNEMITTEEATRVFRVPVGDLVDPKLRVTAVATDRSANQRFGTPAFTVGGTLVWGFTAMILDRVLELLGWAEPWDPRYKIDITGWDATQPVPAAYFDPAHSEVDLTGHK
ncbi:NUDIX hydrolase [Enteractinococcus coprophilus]|uniref:NUDIX domain-containing protein n=1 Tax=Enteractinococcus coprophilus TaxID=1027633 RepID=A0A543AM33_9MICC|nr:CoA pyrophosphatase [Enteractinococcus coprophilus]TQL73654.1 NUDIX domain-containing protein [Enteractinococcus coprophilus]